MTRRPVADASSKDAAGFIALPGDAADHLQPRAFQYEMLEESLQRNVIVAVCFEPDTPTSIGAG